MKGNRAYKGYVAHIAETCHPANPVQLIDQVQVAPNQVSDVQLLQQGLPELQERLRATLLVTDGALPVRSWTSRCATRRCSRSPAG